MNKLDKVLYTGKAHTTGGRDGQSKSDDGKLEVKLSPPGQGTGTNPEQMFAAGYSACFIGAMKAVASGMTGGPKIALPADVSITSDVGIGPIPGGFGIKVAMRITVPGMDKAAAEALVKAAHQVCPYSNATRGNVDVQLKLV